MYQLWMMPDKRLYDKGKLIYSIESTPHFLNGESQVFTVDNVYEMGKASKLN